MVFAGTLPEYKEEHCFLYASKEDRRGPVGNVRLARAAECIHYSVCFARNAALQLRGCCCAAVAAALRLVAAGCCVAAVCCGAASLHDADVWYYLLLFDAALLLNM